FIAYLHAQASLANSILRGNTAMGVMIDGESTADIAGVTIDGVREGLTLLVDHMTVTTIADGILAGGTSTVNIRDTSVRGASRAGLFFLRCSGSLVNVTSRGNGYGIVLQDQPWPSYG